MNETRRKTITVHDPRTGWQPVPANLLSEPNFARGYICYLHSRSESSFESLNRPVQIDNFFMLGWAWALSFERENAGRRDVNWLESSVIDDLNRIDQDTGLEWLEPRLSDQAIK